MTQDVAKEKTAEHAKAILKKEGLAFEPLLRINDWLLNPETCEWTNMYTAETGFGIYELIKKVRFS